MIARKEKRTLRISHVTRIVLGATALAIIAVGVAASPALADPSWDITLSTSPTTLPRSDERIEYAIKVTNIGDSPTTAPVAVTLELPGGSETTPFVVKIPGGPDNFPAMEWKCESAFPTEATRGSVSCTRTNSNPLAPGASFSQIGVVAHLGADAPEPSGTAIATVSGGGAPASASDEAQYTFTDPIPFGPAPGSFFAGVFDEFGADHTAAGAHPFRGYTTFGFNVKTTVKGEIFGVESTKDIVFDTARGFVGNALSAPELCDSIEDVVLALCPPDSAVGGVDVFAGPLISLQNYYQTKFLVPETEKRPLYSVVPEFGVPAQFAFGINALGGLPYTFVPELRADEGYAISFRTAPIIAIPPIHGTNINLCDFGANLVDAEKFGVEGPLGLQFQSCRQATDANANPKPLITNPTRCSGHLAAGLRVDSWEHPQEVKTAESPLPTPTDCDLVPFEPEAKLVPTNHEADSPTGLGVELDMPTDGLLSPIGTAQANLDNVTVTLPKGMSINPAAADGLSSCTLEQVKLGSNSAAECPPSSKVGEIEIDTPLIRKTLTGNIYVAKQNDNPFHAPLGLYMVFSSARDGVTVKIAGKLTPDPQTGQLVSSFVENPEWPFSHLALHFNSGPRSPLINPPKCGTYAIRAEFSPWSAVNPANPTPDEIATSKSTYEVSSGPSGSPCPAGDLQPTLSAGLQGSQAGASSPFFFSLSRDDGTQRFDKIKIDTPPGLTASLKGIPYCTDAQLGSISGEEEAGRPELATPTCPPASQVGTSEAGAGSGPFPFYTKGKVYLAGPYKGAPVSLAVVTPAVAGPYDLGNVVVRNPLYLNPVTSQVTTESDTIPTIIHGVLLDVRDIRVNLDRHPFTQAPTNCNEMSVNATVHGEEGANASLSNRFQVGGCEKLGFEPKLGFRLFGGTHRGSHPRLQATVTYPSGGGYANNASASVALPHSEFLDQAHIKTVCTRVQFAADACPPGSIYGEAEATSPLLDYPLKGPAILRSSDHQLPDLVLALKGPASQPIEIDLAGRIDSVHGGIRTTFEQIPDQPVSSFVLRMQGGKKGLLVNSRDICAGKTPKATGVFNAQNGLSKTLRPKMRSACKAQAKKAKRHNKRHHH